MGVSFKGMGVSSNEWEFPLKESEFSFKGMGVSFKGIGVSFINLKECEVAACFIISYDFQIFHRFCKVFELRAENTVIFVSSACTKINATEANKTGHFFVAADLIG